MPDDNVLVGVRFKKEGMELRREEEEEAVCWPAVSTWRRMISSWSRVAWERTHCSAPADSRVGSATTITFLGGAGVDDVVFVVVVFLTAFAPRAGDCMGASCGICR